jgi:hypothetical protein
MPKMIEMDENVRLAAQLEEAATHAKTKTLELKAHSVLLRKEQTLTMKSRVQHHALFYALFHI